MSLVLTLDNFIVNGNETVDKFVKLGAKLIMGGDYPEYQLHQILHAGDSLCHWLVQNSARWNKLIVDKQGNW